ncbi:MAG: hypothetical protein WD184_08430 [Acidimicrobiia bacterium]
MRSRRISLGAAVVLLALAATPASAGEPIDCGSVEPAPGTRPPPLDGDFLLLNYDDFEAGISSLSIWDLDTLAEAIDLTGDFGFQAFDGAWSPVGDQIAYSSDESGLPMIWVIDVDGTDRRQVTRTFGTSPDWSPDGLTIAFSGSGGLWFVDARGCGERLVFETDKGIHDVEWMPDGSAIVLEMSEPEGVPIQIYSLSMPGFELTQLTDEGSSIEPALSLDGRFIFFRTTGRDVDQTVFVMNADGSLQRPLYDLGLTNDFHPAVSPTGDRVAFESIRDSASALVILSVDGSVTDLVVSPFEEPRYRDPVWYHGVTATEHPSPGTETTTTTAGEDATTTSAAPVTTTAASPGATTTTAAAATTTVGAAGPADPKGGVPALVWILIGALVLTGAFVGGIAYAGRRESHRPAPPPPPPPPPPEG